MQIINNSKIFFIFNNEIMNEEEENLFLVSRAQAKVFPVLPLPPHRKSSGKKQEMHCE